jgi:hypothetical protein
MSTLSFSRFIVKISTEDGCSAIIGGRRFITDVWEVSSHKDSFHSTSTEAIYSTKTDFFGTNKKIYKASECSYLVNKDSIGLD